VGEGVRVEEIDVLIHAMSCHHLSADIAGNGIEITDGVHDIVYR
jgi:hypothetical protein